MGKMMIEISAPPKRYGAYLRVDWRCRGKKHWYQHRTDGPALIVMYYDSESCSVYPSYYIKGNATTSLNKKTIYEKIIIINLIMEINLVQGRTSKFIRIEWCELTPTIRWVWHRTDGPAALYYNLDSNCTEMIWALNNMAKLSKIKGGL